MSFARGALRLLVVSGLLATPACKADGKGTSLPPSPPAKRDVLAQDYVAPPLPHAHVLLPDAFGGQHRIDVEVANTPDSRERGLMWRSALAEDRGMLFIFPEEEIQSFWMRNTLIPLDMLFIDQHRRILGIVEHAVPHTRTPRGVGRPTLYVLEVPGGWVERMGVRAGSLVQLEGVAPAAL